jgi:hypothetical protein
VELDDKHVIRFDVEEPLEVVHKLLALLAQDAPWGHGLPIGQQTSLVWTRGLFAGRGVAWGFQGRSHGNQVVHALELLRYKKDKLKAAGKGYQLLI